MEAYKIWATLNLKGDAQKQMEKLLGMTQRLSKQMEKLSTVMKFSRATQSIETTTRRMHRLGTEITGVTKQAERAARAMRKMNVPIGGIGKGGGMGGAGMVGGLAAGASMMGFGAAGAALGGAALIKSSFHVGSEFQKEMALAVAQRIPGANAKSINLFLEKTNLPGISKLDLIQSFTDALVITKESGSAFSVAPTLATMGYIGKTYGAEGFKFSKAQLQAAIKTVEIVSGTRDPAILNTFLEMMMQTWVSTAGRVQPAQYQAIARNMRGYARGLDPKFFFYMLEPLIQEFGTSMGPQLAMFYQHLVAGRLTTQGANLLMQGTHPLMGASSVMKDPLGRIIETKLRPVKNIGMAQENPFEWLEKEYIPFLEGLGAKTAAEQMGVSGKIFSNRDLTMVNAFLQQREKIMGSYQANLRIGGMQSLVEGAPANAKSTEELSKAWTNLRLAIDKFDNPTTRWAMWTLTGFLENLTTMINVLNHPLDTIRGAAGEFHQRNFTDSAATHKAINVTVHTHLGDRQIVKAFSRSLTRTHDGTVEHGQNGTNGSLMATSTSMPSGPGGSFSQ